MTKSLKDITLVPIRQNDESCFMQSYLNVHIILVSHTGEYFTYCFKNPVKDILSFSKHKKDFKSEFFIRKHKKYRKKLFFCPH